MNLVDGYGDDGGEENDKEMKSSNLLTNPVVNDYESEKTPYHIFSGESSVNYNPTYEEMNRVQYGTGSTNQDTNDSVDKYYMDDFAFDQQYYKSQRTRKRKIKKIVHEDSVELEFQGKNEEEKKKLMEKFSGFPVEAFVIEEDEEESKEKDYASHPEKKEKDDDHVSKKRKLMSHEIHAPIRSGELLRPKNIKVTQRQKTRLPKKLFCHFKKAHSKGVNRILFFPSTGHLLLSGSIDSTVKLWDVHQRKKLLMTYFGYGLSIHDLCFFGDGSHFVSTHGNGAVKVWDTEMGKVVTEHMLSDEIDPSSLTPSLTDFSSKKKKRKMIATCARVNPVNENEFLCGYQTNQIIQWDRRVKNFVRNYDKHQRGICDILYIHQGSRFLSSSHDGSIRVWEYGNNEDSIKYISENYVKVALKMQMHPEHPFFLVQSITNSIYMFRIQSLDEYRFFSRKKFTGHKLSKYPIGFGISSDGKWIYSGDAEGNIWWWRWDEEDVIEKKMNFHKNVVMDTAWNPNHRSMFASCGWDGDIKVMV